MSGPLEESFNSYVEFEKIVEYNYDPSLRNFMENEARKLFMDLDYARAEELLWENDSDSDENVPYDFDKDNLEDWDFPNPPEFLR
jgi:hypothetical protein